MQPAAAEALRRVQPEAVLGRHRNLIVIEHGTRRVQPGWHHCAPGRPIRSRRSPVRYAPLSWAAQTTGITPRRPASCRPACAGVMPAPAAPACWPPGAANAPASAANASNAGAARNPKLHNRAGARSWPAHYASRNGPANANPAPCASPEAVRVPSRHRA